MELKEFLIKFLPDYEDKIKEVVAEKNITARTFAYWDFQRKHFPEALQNFADRICDEQVGNVQLSVEEAIRESLVNTYELRYIDREMERIFKIMANAKQPKIDEL
jgi:hypothetical protein